MLRHHVTLGVEEVEADAVGQLQHGERAERSRRGQPEHLADEPGLGVLVVGVDDGVVQFDGHAHQDGT
ncbi:hypothetical protein BJF90_20975 [Pseudonocardia sp. CNS-004]|nr:hypothetical protein BJF90_20975 [Pseudonocardia sp. CNS-004]